MVRLRAAGQPLQRKVPRAVLVIFCAAGIAGCTTTRGTFCSIAKPHRFSDATVNAMTDAEVAQELTFNKQGAALCGWSLPSHE